MISSQDFLLTQKSLSQLALINTNSKVFTHVGWKQIEKIRLLGDKPSYQLQTNLGYELIAFDEQRLAVKSSKGFKFTALKNLEVGDSILLLPGENFNFDLVISEKVTRPTSYNANVKDEFNGPFSVELACLIGYLYARNGIDWATPQWTPDFFNNAAGLLFTFNDALNKEHFRAGETHFDAQLENKYSYDLKDPLFFQWLKNNHIDALDPERLPQFLFSSPSKVVAGYLLGFLFARYKNFRTYQFDFNFTEWAKQIQLLLLREGIITTRTDTTIEFVTEKSRNEFDRLLAKANIYKHPCEVWDKEPAQAFYEMQITQLETQEKQEAFEVTLEVSEGLQVGGFYVGSD